MSLIFQVSEIFQHFPVYFLIINNSKVSSKDLTHNGCFLGHDFHQGTQSRAHLPNGECKPNKDLFKRYFL